MVVRFGPLRKCFTDDDFFEFCQINRDLRIEMTSEGEMIIMMPVGGEGSNRNFILTSRFGVWVESDRTGIGFDSSVGFRLPNGAERSPDASWVRLDRWNAVSKKDRRKSPPICPDFVIELRSETDSLTQLKAKMEEYIDNGAQLGWLIDPKKKRIHLYRPHAKVEILKKPKTISGEPLLKGFKLDLAGILT
ncbi:MAG: Uma2 family endonuclease [Blastocatellia bacterium]